MKLPSVFLVVGIVLLAGCGPQGQQQQPTGAELDQADTGPKEQPAVKGQPGKPDTKAASVLSAAPARKVAEGQKVKPSEPSRPNGKEQEKARPVEALKKQVTQKDFVKLIESFSDRYESAPNELKKSTLRVERRKALQDTLSGSNVTNWSGTLKSMRTTTAGNAMIEVKLAGSTAITFTNKNTNVFMDEPLIAHGSGLYKKIAELSTGDTVLFSGKLLIKEHGHDHLAENSWTESGSMKEPEFVFRFTDVSKTREGKAEAAKKMPDPKKKQADEEAALVKEIKAATDKAKKGPVIVSNLLKEYDENEVGADRKYKDKMMIYAGTVDRVAKDILGNPYVILRSNHPGIVARVLVYPAKQAKTKFIDLAKLKPGDLIAIAAKCQGKSVNVLLQGFVIAELEED